MLACSLALALTATCRNESADQIARSVRVRADVDKLLAEMGSECTLVGIDAGMIVPRHASIEECDGKRRFYIDDLQCKALVGHEDDNLKEHVTWWVEDRRAYDACLFTREPQFLAFRDSWPREIDVPPAIYDASDETFLGKSLLVGMNSCGPNDAGASFQACRQKYYEQIARASCEARARRDGGHAPEDTLTAAQAEFGGGCIQRLMAEAEAQSTPRGGTLAR